MPVRVNHDEVGLPIFRLTSGELFSMKIGKPTFILPA